MKIICEVQKNSRELLRVILDNYKGHEICDIRVHYEKEPGIWLPGPKGITFSTRFLCQISAALQEAERVLNIRNPKEVVC